MDRAGESESSDWEAWLSYRAALVGFEEVRHLDPVKGFRDRHLPDGEPIDGPRRVLRWVRDRVAESDALSRPGPDPAETLGIVDLADSMRGLYPHRPASEIPTPTAPMDDVSFVVDFWPNGDWHSIQTKPYGAAGELFWLGYWLQDRFGWHPAYARGWVIARGALPVVFPLRPTRRHRREPEAPGLSQFRVLFDVPLDTPPSRLQDELRRVQAERADAYRWPLPPKSRPIGLGHLKATLYAVERNDGAAWEDILDQWNRDRPADDWEYRSGPQAALLFAQTVRRAYRSLMDRDLKWKRQRAAHRTK